MLTITMALSIATIVLCVCVCVQLDAARKAKSARGLRVGARIASCLLEYAKQLDIKQAGNFPHTDRAAGDGNGAAVGAAA